MTPDTTAPPVLGDRTLTRPDMEVLGFVAEMSGVQLDQLATLLTDQGKPAEDAAGLARQMVARWRAAGYAETGELSLGEPWVWATRKGLAAFGLRARLVRPKEASLRHTHAVTDVRLALERTSAYRADGGSWRAERQILTRLPFPARSEHIPDGEVHWPAAGGSPWAGQAWAVEVEISRKSVERVAAIMAEVLARAGDWDSPPASAATARAPRYARLVYACSRAAVRTVLAARAELGAPRSARVEVYDLPESATRLHTPKRGWEP
jgi:hypothetical protein